MTDEAVLVHERFFLQCLPFLSYLRLFPTIVQSFLSKTKAFESYIDMNFD